MHAAASNRSIVVASVIVFAVAIALRVPACYESFWVDELHSAWCVWDGIGDVAPRADIGHQSPFYFLGLWFWKQFFGGSELALRMSSVLAVATSCVVLTVGVAKWSRSLSAGVTAGWILAIENNALFFGTELRPFSLVILCSSIAVVCFARLAALDSRHTDQRSWIGMIVAILLAALCQPTSLGVLILLPATVCCVWLVRDRRQLLRITLSDGLLLLTVAGVLFALWSMTLDESWGARGSWATFASATSIAQVWFAWDWAWLWLAPMAVLIPAVWIGRADGLGRMIGPTLLLSAIAVVATLGYWFVAWMEWLPLWHRRYYIAVLPMFGFIAGGSVAVVSNCTKFRKLAPIVSICLITGLMIGQSMHRQLLHYPVALVSRGEDWRGAIDWVRSHANPRDSIYLESGLIEWGRNLPTGEKHIEYYLFPFSGPYQPNQKAAAIDPALGLPLYDLYDDTKGIFMIVRRPKSQILINSTKFGWVYGNRYLGEVKSFGNVTVISMPTLEVESVK